MILDRANELLQSGKLFQMSFGGLVRGYKLTQIIKVFKELECAQLIYHNTPWGSGGFKCSQYPLEMIEEFEGPLHPQDRKFLEEFEEDQKPKSRRTKGIKKSRRTK